MYVKNHLGSQMMIHKYYTQNEDSKKKARTLLKNTLRLIVTMNNVILNNNCCFGKSRQSNTKAPKQMNGEKKVSSTNGAKTPNK